MAMVTHHPREDTAMPAPATVTDEQIRDAGQDIIAAGRRVSGYSLRAQLGGRGEPRRLMAVWQQTRPQPPAPADQMPAVAAPPLPPDLAAYAATLRERLTAEFDVTIAAAWVAAERRAAERLGGEVEVARAAAEAAGQAQADADEALAAADIARDAAETDRDRLAVEATEARAAADRATGQRAAADAERDRLVAELSQARQAIAEAERHTAAAGAAREAAEASAKQAQQIAEAAREAAEADRRTSAADVATARAQLAGAQAEAAEARRVLTAAAEERGRLLQRAEAAEAQLAALTAATPPAEAKPGRDRSAPTRPFEGPAT
jgi:colicin import membrane protein